MGVLKTRIKRIEVKCSGESGIHKWTMGVAESHAHSEKFRIESLGHLHTAIEKSTGKKQPKPRPPKFQTDVEIKKCALELSPKYQSYENYMKNRESINIELTNKLKKIINR